MVFRVHDEPSEDKLERFRDFALRFGHYFKAQKGRAVAKEMNKLLTTIAGSAEQNAITTLAVRSMAKAMCDAGLPARVSYSAGTYVCNDLLYTLLAHFHGSEARVGFIHVPYCTEQGKEPAMTIDDIVKGLAVAIQNIG
jgi:pyrrolidone-carboxylate peptidase